MGRNNKRNKAITKMYLKPLQKYCQQLEAELEALKTDPSTTLGQVITQARELYTQNSRLSTLCAALIAKQGDKVELHKDTMTKYEGKRILIKWELPEGCTKPEETEAFVFTYEISDPQQVPQAQQVKPAPTETPECTREDCKLPKDFKHVHTDEPEDVPDAVANVKLTAEDGTTVEGEAELTLNGNEVEAQFTEPPTVTLSDGDSYTAEEQAIETGFAAPGEGD